MRFKKEPVRQRNTRGPPKWVKRALGRNATARATKSREQATKKKNEEQAMKSSRRAINKTTDFIQSLGYRLEMTKEIQHLWDRDFIKDCLSLSVHLLDKIKSD